MIAAPAATQADIGTTAILCHPLTSRRHRAPFCLPHRLIGVRHAAVGTTVAAAGGGLLVVVGVVIAALAVPAFVRYRVAPMVVRDDQSEPDKV